MYFLYATSPLCVSSLPPPPLRHSLLSYIPPLPSPLSPSSFPTSPLSPSSLPPLPFLPPSHQPLNYIPWFAELSHRWRKSGSKTSLSAVYIPCSESIPVPPPPLLPRHPCPTPPLNRSSFRTDEMMPLRTALNSGAGLNLGNAALATNFGPELYICLGHPPYRLSSRRLSVRDRLDVTNARIGKPRDVTRFN